MKALTLWQPWASLIVVGAKPFEFRKWKAHRSVIGQRIVIHASARPMAAEEIRQIVDNLKKRANAGFLHLRPAARRRCGMSEQIYDEQIAPKLLEVGKLCEQHGLPLVAQVEYAPSDFGMTKFLPENSNLLMKLMFQAGACGNNVDSLFIAIERHAREHGHSSIYLRRLGIPLQPEKGEAA